MKKIISIFLALVIIMTAIPIAPVPVAGRVVSDTDDEEEYIYYTGVKTYDTPITMCVKSEKAILYKNLYDTAGQIVKERIEGGANEKAVLRLFINCPFVCINFDFFWLNKARQLYMDF